MKKLFLICLFATFFSPFLTSSSFAYSENNNISSLPIVGGTDSEIDQWPSIVSLKKKYNQTHFCGATLIAENWLLTAAHCLVDSNGIPLLPDIISATLGEYDLSSASLRSNVDIEKIIAHPFYNSETQVNDIALLKLSKATTHPIMAIASESITLNSEQQQQDVTVIGWGSMTAYDSGETVSTSFPYLLQQVTLPLMTHSQCQLLLGDYFTSEMLCAGLIEGSKDSCQGDSGGPMMVDSAIGWQQIGIVSWGYGCAAAAKPGVYTRVAAYQAWITAITAPISVQSIIKFNTTPINSSETQFITLSNNTNEEVAFTFDLSGSPFFSAENSQCMSINANSRCSLAMTYNPQTLKKHEAQLIISTNISASIPKRVSLIGKPLIDAGELFDSLHWSASNALWYTDMSQSWQPDSFYEYLQTSNNNQLNKTTLSSEQAILMTAFTETGLLQFNWAASVTQQSQKLTLFINNVAIDSVNNNGNFQTYRIFLGQQSSKVAWIYDQPSVSKNNRARLAELSFTPMDSEQYNELTKINVSSEKSAGAMPLFTWLLLPLFIIRFKQRKTA